MRHAFLIIAHNNWWQLKTLIQLLDAENHDMYIHIDKKSLDFKLDEFSDVTQYSKVFFIQEYKVYWGGFSLVEAELLLLEKAFEQHYDYYHIISGADLPLKCNQEIDTFFEENYGKQFIDYDDIALKNNPEITRRTRYYHFLQNYRRCFRYQWINVFFTFLERVSLVIQIIFRVNRVKNLEWEIKYGSNWVSITEDLVKTILEQKSKIRKVFLYTNCSDELFVQTIAYNFGFGEEIYQPVNEQNANVRYIDWKRGNNGNPYTFRIEDLSEFGASNPNMFARKFSQMVDKEIILEIGQRIKNNNK